MATGVMHSLPVKLCPVITWPLAASGHRPVVTFPKVEMMIDMPVEMISPMEPWADPDKYTAREPLRPIVAVWRAVVRGDLVISVRANGRFANAYRNLRGSTMGSNYKQARSESHQRKISHWFHKFTLSLGS